VLERRNIPDLFINQPVRTANKQIPLMCQSVIFK